MNPQTEIVAASDVARLIRSIRDQRVIVDADLAVVYGVRTKAFVQAVERNAERFPEDFLFQLSSAEAAALRSQIVTSNRARRAPFSPSVFTEHGALMAAKPRPAVPSACQVS